MRQYHWFYYMQVTHEFINQKSLYSMLRKNGSDSLKKQYARVLSFNKQ